MLKKHKLLSKLSDKRNGVVGDVRNVATQIKGQAPRPATPTNLMDDSEGLGATTDILEERLLEQGLDSNPRKPAAAKHSQVSHWSYKELDHWSCWFSKSGRLRIWVNCLQKAEPCRWSGLGIEGKETRRQGVSSRSSTGKTQPPVWFFKNKTEINALVCRPAGNPPPLQQKQCGVLLSQQNNYGTSRGPTTAESLEQKENVTWQILTALRPWVTNFQKYSISINNFVFLHLYFKG